MTILVLMQRLILNKTTLVLEHGFSGIEKALLLDSATFHGNTHNGRTARAQLDNV
jgi:hypothetical protein